MTRFDLLLLQPPQALLVLNVVVASTLTLAVGATTAHLLRRTSAPLRHAIFVAALFLSLTAPAIVVLAGPVGGGLSMFRVPLPRAWHGEARVGTGPGNQPIAERPVTQTPEERTEPGAFTSDKSGRGGRPERTDAGRLDLPTTTPVTLTGEPPRVPWLAGVATLLASLWLLGTVVAVVRLLRGWRIVAHWLREARNHPDARVTEAARDAFGRVGLTRTPAVLLSPWVPVPVSLGWPRPRILLPADIATALDDVQLQAVLVHEAAHLARRDPWVGLAERVAAAVYWWNPLVHYVCAQLDEVREDICDDYVIRVQGVGRPLAQVLVALAARALPGANALPGVTGVVSGGRHALEARVTRLLTRNAAMIENVSIGLRARLVVVALALALTVGVSAALPRGRAEAFGQDAERPAGPNTGQGTAAPKAGQDEPPRQNPSGANVTLLRDRNEYFLGENVLLHFHLENQGDKPFVYAPFASHYPGLRIHADFRFVATPIDGEGKPTGPPIVGPQLPDDWGGPVGVWHLQPGDVYHQTLYLPRNLRLEQPGRYRIVVEKCSRDRRTVYCFGTTTLTFKMPNENEARRIYERMKTLPREPVAESNQYVTTEIADFSALRLPVYLPILEEYVREKDFDALDGLADMATPASVAALVGLVDHFLRGDDVTSALKVYQRVSGLPDPRVLAEAEDSPKRKYVERVWRPAFAPVLRRLARELARSPEPIDLYETSFIYECAGEAGDLGDLALGYTKAIERTKTLPFETHQYFRPRGSAYHYRFSTRQLLARGAKPPLDPKTPGEAAVYMIALASQKDFRPSNWPDVVTRLLGEEPPYLKEMILDHLPTPIPQAVLDRLPQLLLHDYVDLAIAACHQARKHPQLSFQEPLLTVLKNGREQYLLNAASAAALSNGVPRDRVMEVWLSRIGSADLDGNAVLRLLLSILEDNQASSMKLDAPAREAAVQRWRRFIEENREQLRTGRQFKIGDPEITPDLFPRGFQFYFNGQPWPPGNR